MGRYKLISLIKKYIKGFVPVNINVDNVVIAQNQLLANKVAIVTGASSGIGNATTKAMLNSGATVVALARNSEKLNSLKIELESERFIPYPCDISKIEEIELSLKEIIQLISKKNVDVLVNCAGVKNGNDERFFEYTPEEFSYVVDTNLKGTFFWCQKIAQYMIEKKIRGHIVNVTSIKGFIGEASPYSVSKWGCTGLTKGLGRMLAPYGIVVNGVAPGGTATAMAKFKKGDSMFHPATPSQRLADPNEIANLIVYLASDLGSNVVGDVIALN